MSLRAFLELELQIIRARVKSQMRNAKAKGAKIGRPQTTKDEIRKCCLSS